MDRLKPTILAIDTCVLMDLARPDDTTIDCFDTIARRLPNFVILVLPTVLEELQDISLNHTLDEQAVANRAFQLIIQRKYRIQAVNCIPVGHGIVEQTGKKLISQQLLPEEELHDSFVLAEAALAEASILISADAHLIGINPSRLKITMDNCDLCTPLIASPRKIVRDFFS
jgi:hypothetical protein